MGYHGLQPDFNPLTTQPRQKSIKKGFFCCLLPWQVIHTITVFNNMFVEQAVKRVKEEIFLKREFVNMFLVESGLWIFRLLQKHLHFDFKKMQCIKIVINIFISQICTLACGAISTFATCHTLKTSLSPKYVLLFLSKLLEVQNRKPLEIKFKDSKV